MGEAFSVKDTVSTNPNGGVSVNVPRKQPKGNLESMRRTMAAHDKFEAQERAAYEKNISGETIDLVNSSVVSQVKENTDNIQPAQPMARVLPPHKAEVIEEVEEKEDLDALEAEVLGDDEVEEDMIEENTVEEAVEEEVVEDEFDTEDDVIEEESTSEEETNSEEETKEEDTSVYDDGSIQIETTSTTVDEETLDEDLDVEVKPESTAQSEAKKMLVSLQNQVSAKIKPVNKRRNLEGFTVATNPITTNSIFKTPEVAVAKWPLPVTGITIQMRAVFGSDLEDLQGMIESNDARGVLQKLYDAIVSPKAAFNVWVKQIAFQDYDHIFMALYIASFKGANYMMVQCEGGDKCPEKTYITDDIPFAKLVKYKDNETKEKFQKLYKEAPADNYGLVPTEIVPITDNIAIGFVDPSIYSVLMEPDYFDADFRRKYGVATAVAPYIDRFYYIDYEQKKYVPIGYKIYENNEAKTAKSKIIKYNHILRSFSSDEIAALKAYMQAINQKNNTVTYVSPATTCPFCGTENPEHPDTAAQMLFTRNQLAALVNTFEN